jgi:hypothetical protein
MQLFTLNVTDLTEFDSPAWEQWLSTEDLPVVGPALAREVAKSIPALVNRGMCIAIYDKSGIAVALVPLDSVQ